MILLEKIKIDLDAARKEKPQDKNKIALLSTLHSEAKMVGKNDGDRQPTDEEVIKKVLFFIKNVKTSIENLQKFNKPVEKEKKEIELLNVYLPGKLTDEELEKVIREIVNALPEKDKIMGRVMKQLEEKYVGRYEGKVASKLVNKVLS